MEVIIEAGATIIKFNPIDKNANTKYGALGVYMKSEGIYAVEIFVNKKKYYLGIRKSVEEAKALRFEAEEKIVDGTFHEWLKKLTSLKHGVKGLYFVNDRNVYRLSITYQKKKYFIRDFKSPEDAASVREEADLHINNGTFLEWLDEYKKSMKMGKSK